MKNVAPNATAPDATATSTLSLTERLDAAGRQWRADLEAKGYVVVFNVLRPCWSGLALRENVRDPIEMDQKALMALGSIGRRALHERLCK